MLFQCQKLLKNRKCLNFLMFLQGVSLLLIGLKEMKSFLSFEL